MEKTLSRSFLIISSLFLLIFPSASPQEGINKGICQTKRCLSAAQNLNESMNIGVDPCDNFYLYACGNWPKVHNRTQSTLELRNEENNRDILDFLKQENTPCEPEAVHKARQFFSQCLDESAYTGRIEQIIEMLLKIGLRVIPFIEYGKFDYGAILGKATRLTGVKVYFDVGLAPHPYNKTKNVIALKKPTRKMDTRFRKSRLTEKSLSEERIRQRKLISEIVLKLCLNETKGFCTASDPSSNENEPHTALINIIEKNNDRLSKFLKNATAVSKNRSDLISLSELLSMAKKVTQTHETKLPEFNWKGYFGQMFDGLNVDLSQPDRVTIICQDRNYIEKMMEFLITEKSMSIELDIWWQVVNTLLPYVELKTSDTKNTSTNDTSDFDKYRQIREERCAEITSEALPVAISYGYTMKEKHIIAKTKVEQMFANLRGVYEQMVHQATWMNDETKQKALKKLHFLKSNIGYPSTFHIPSTFDDVYRDVKIGDTFFDTMVSKIQLKINETYSTLNKTVDRTKQQWTSPHTVDATYRKHENALFVQTGLLGGPIYNDSLRALDYGAIGSILGHEMSFALDDTGRIYDESGKKGNWWPEETIQFYQDTVYCFVDAYDSYDIILKNGLTLEDEDDDGIADRNEHIADSVGFKTALLAYRKSLSEFGEEPLLAQFHNFTHEQLFSLAYANVFCENPTWNSVANQTTGVSNRSRNIIRVNGVLKTSKEFSQIWNCPKDSTMNRYDKCSVW